MKMAQLNAMHFLSNGSTIKKRAFTLMHLRCILQKDELKKIIT